MVYDVFHTDKGIWLVCEDLSGSTNVFVPKDSEMFPVAKTIVCDEVVGIFGKLRKKYFHAHEIYRPPIPHEHKFNCIPEEIYALFLSDIHVGSTKFLEKTFINVIKWLHGTLGSEKSKKVAAKVGYILIAGDIVDGVGVYKNQRKELNIPDIYKQYETFVKYIEDIPEDIKIIIIPGNHDPSREAEPQPPLSPLFVDLKDYKNIFLGSNPSEVVLHRFETEGVKVLIYHGASLDSVIDFAKIHDGYDRPEKVQIELLERRHLNPFFGRKSRVFPERRDYLVIDSIPDIFHCGHVHTTGTTIYRGIRVINSGCFQGLTHFQEKLGHKPTPGKIPCINLNTGGIRIINFV
jgi:DNA polymerase II small subunit